MHGTQFKRASFAGQMLTLPPSSPSWSRSVTLSLSGHKLIGCLVLGPLASKEGEVGTYGLLRD